MELCCWIRLFIYRVGVVAAGTSDLNQINSAALLFVESSLFRLQCDEREASNQSIVKYRLD